VQCLPQTACPTCWRWPVPSRSPKVHLLKRARARAHRQSCAKNKVVPSLSFTLSGSDSTHGTAKMQSSRIRVGQLLAESQSGLARHSTPRCFTTSARRAQQPPPPRGPPPPPPPPPKSAESHGTTHFGFETIAEALKEQRGEFAVFSPAPRFSLRETPQLTYTQSAPSSRPSPRRTTR
jgi:hypothetical protein